MKRGKLLTVSFMLLFFMPVLSHGLDTRKVPLTSFHEVADYIKKYDRLPDNFITKKDAGTLGWNPSKGNLWAVAPGKSIGGDVFRNREKKLPVKRGRIWYEADIDYQGGKRGKDRILFSSDGLIYKTEDHYRTFTRMH
jgi:hypothetical protein